MSFSRSFLALTAAVVVSTFVLSPVAEARGGGGGGRGGGGGSRGSRTVRNNSAKAKNDKKRKDLDRDRLMQLTHRADDASRDRG
jgi:hypothetical protein